MNNLRFAYRLGFYDGRKAAINYTIKFIKDLCGREPDYDRLLTFLEKVNENVDTQKFKFMDREEPENEN